MCIRDRSYDTEEFTKEDMQARLETLERQYETAPETASEKTVSDGTMQPYSRETLLGAKEGLRLSVSAVSYTHLIIGTDPSPMLIGKSQ